MGTHYLIMKKWGQSDFLGLFDYSHRRRSFNIQYFGLYKWSICCINLTLPKPLASFLISSWLKETLLTCSRIAHNINSQDFIFNLTFELSGRIEHRIVNRREVPDLSQ